MHYNGLYDQYNFLEIQYDYTGCIEIIGKVYL